MRKIERLMVAAIRAGKSRTIGNTAVRCNGGGAWAVLLHGNHIASSGHDGLAVTLAHWPTPTTRSRVNALLREFAAGCCVYQSKHAQFATVRGESREISAGEWLRVSAD
jgi:hypothetical protein